MRLPAASLFAALAMAGVASAAPVTVVDSFNRSVTVERTPQRIIPLFASNTEIAAALGLTDKIVGIDGMTHFPPAVMKKPVVGNRLGFSVDAVVDQRPDLLVVTPSRQAVNQLLEPMRRLGVPVIILQQRSVAEILDNIRLVGRAAGVPGRGEALATSLKARLDAVAARAPEGRGPTAVIVTGKVGTGLLLVAKTDSYTWDAARLAGARFALKGKLVIPQVSPEAILRADPDVLLFAGVRKDLDELINRQGWRELRAVREGRAYTIPRGEFSIPGPRTIKGVERLDALFHGRKLAEPKA